MSKDVSRLFTFVLRSRILIVGRERLRKSKHKLQMVIIAEDISDNSKREILRDFEHYPIIQRYVTEDFDRFFRVKHTRVIGLAKSSLASSIYKEMKEFRINHPDATEEPEVLASRKCQIAIDGPAASGKSTIAQKIAERLGGFYVNTGDMYRTVTWKALEAGIDPVADPDSVAGLLFRLDIRYMTKNSGLILTCNDVPVDRALIRTPEVTANVSHVAKLPIVRQWMIERQRESASLGLVVAEGRDIGTVVFPEAKWKFFVTATPMERARRRLAQDGEAADDATLETVAAEIAERDRIDSTRDVAPLKQADDAILIDSTEMTIDDVLETILTHVTG